MFTGRLRHGFLVCTLLVSSVAFAQIKIGNNLKITGSTNFQYAYYSFNNINNGAGAPKQPTHFPQFAGRFSVNYKNSLRIPVSLYLNPLIQVSGAINTPMEGPNSLNIFQYLSHPSNNIYANPSFKNIKFHLGHFTQAYSPLTVGDIKVFGIGAEYSFGKMSIAAQRGVIQPRVLNTIFNFNNGAYTRRLTAFSWRMKPGEKLKVGANFAFTGDNQNSLEQAPSFTVPEQSAVISVESKYQYSKQSHVRLEISSSSWAPNLSLGDSLREFGPGRFLIPNTSILGGTAFELSGAHNKKNYQVNARVGYRSENFRTLAYPYLQSDMFEFEVSPRFTAFQKKLQTSATLGYKTSDVSKSTGRALRIPIAKLSSRYKFNEALSLTGIYAFNSVNSTADSTRPDIKTSNQIIRILPGYRFKYKDFKNMVSLVFGLSQYANNSSVLPQPAKTATQNIGAVYQVIYDNHTAGISVNKLNTTLNGAKFFTYNTIIFNARTQVLDKKLSPFIRLSYTGVHNATTKTGSKRVGQLGARYTVTKKMTASLAASLQHHKQGIGNDQPGFRELFVRTGLSYRL